MYLLDILLDYRPKYDWEMYYLVPITIIVGIFSICYSVFKEILLDGLRFLK